MKIAANERHHLKIVHVGTEPLVTWSRDEEDDLPRFTVFWKDWRLRSKDRKYEIILGHRGVGYVSATVTADGGDPLVPSDEAPTDRLEHGDILRIGASREHDDKGWTVGELRAVAIEHRRRRRWRRPS